MLCPNLVLSSLLRIDWSVNPSLCLLNDDSGLCISSMQKRMLFAGFTAVKKIDYFYLSHTQLYREYITSSEMCSLHLTHPKWTHTRSSGQPCYSARGAVGGSVPCSRTPQSWYWRRILPPTNNPCRTWDSNPQPSAYKSDSLSIRPRLPPTIIQNWTIIQSWFTPHMCWNTYWIRSILQIVSCECTTARVGGARPSTIDAWQCFLLDIRDCIKEWLLCSCCPSLSPSLLIGPWDVEYVSVPLFCCILDIMLLCVKKLKIVMYKYMPNPKICHIIFK